MINEYYAFFENYRPLNDEEKKALVENTTFKTFKKGHYFVKQGDLKKDCFIILKGCVREFHQKDLEEITTNFYAEQEFALSLDSFDSGVPSKYSLQCIEDTTVAIGGSEDEQRLYKSCPSLMDLSKQILEKAMSKVYEQMSNFKTLSPEERYQLLINYNSSLTQRVPQYLLASYLGVKPESLSRIRRRLA